MKQSAGGFTIVETMVVLAITGVLFVSLVGVIRGQQGKAQFKSAVTDITSQFQSYISEVSTGYYPKFGKFKCTVDGTGKILLSSTTSNLGENDKCTYLGQAIMLGIPAPSAEPQPYNVYTLVGKRVGLDGSEPKTLRETGTQVLAKGTLNNQVSGWPEVVTTKTLQYGMEVVSMTARNGNVKIAGFAVVVSPSQELTFNSQSDRLESGTVIPVIIPILNQGGTGSGGVDAPKGVDLILSSLGAPSAGGTVDAEGRIGPIDICFASGTTNQSALVTIGSNSSTTSITYEIYETRDCS